MRRLGLVLPLAALLSCAKFTGDLYACNPDTMEDCLVCDATGRWCDDLAPRKLGVTAFLSMSGSSPSNVWAVGEGGKVLAWNGTRWVDRSPGTASTLNSVYAASSSEVFVVGDDATWARWDGARWTLKQITQTDWPDGAGGTYVRPIQALTAVGGNATGTRTAVWATDSSGAILDWQLGGAPEWGLYWDTPDALQFWGISMSQLDGTTFFAGNVDQTTAPKPPRFTVDDWTAGPQMVDVTAATGRALYAAVAVDKSNAWIGGADGLFRWDGAGLTKVTGGGADAAGVGVLAMCQVGATGDDVWAVGLNSLVVHWDGAGWTALTPPTSTLTFWGCYATPTEVFFAADDGTVVRYER